MPLRYKIVNFFVKRKKAIVGGLSQAVAEGLLLWRNVGVEVGENGCAGWGKWVCEGRFGASAD